MLREIIQAISGNLKFCLRNDRVFFVDKCHIQGKSINFVDVVDKVEYTETIDNLDLITFADATIPNKVDLDDITSFLEKNINDHKINNSIFDELVSECNTYKEQFNILYIDKIKEAVIDNNTSNLDKLLIIGCEGVFDLDTCNPDEEFIVKTAYKKLVNIKLNEALLSLDQFIVDVDDRDFEAEAATIKEDLSSNAINYIQSIDTIPLNELFSTWPTLLNPSPFNLNKVSGWKTAI